MKSYRTLATVRLFTGMVGLTDNQVKWRTNCLSKIKDDAYEITGEVVFKTGEVIGLEDPPKPYRKMLQCLEPPEKAPEPTEPKAEPVKPTKRKYSKRKA